MNTSVSEVLDRIAPETGPTPDWEWVLRQASLPDPQRGRDAAHESERERGQADRRFLDAQRLRRPVLLAVCVVVAAALALLVVAPWKGGPTILQRADAAINPGGSQVLYMNFGPCCSQMWTSGRDHTQLWVEGSAPRSFRSVGQPMFGYSEHGGTLGPETSLGTQPVTSYIAYNPTTNTLVEHTRGFDNGKPLNFDPLTVVRSALAAGTAHLEGHTVIDGERAIEITLTIRDLDGHAGTVIYLADAKTYHPIEIKYQSLAALSYPFEPIFRPHGRGWSLSIRFERFEYLTDSPTNLALTNIRAQHPKTRIVRCNGYQCTVIRNQPKGAPIAPTAPLAPSTRHPHSGAHSITQNDVPKIAAAIRTCMLKHGASSVTPNRPGGYGGIAHFPDLKQPFAWSWVNPNGSPLPIANPGAMPRARDRSAAAARERLAVDTCLRP